MVTGLRKLSTTENGLSISRKHISFRSPESLVTGQVLFIQVSGIPVSTLQLLRLRVISSNNCTDPLEFRAAEKPFLYNEKKQLVTPHFDGESGDTDVLPLVQTSTEKMRQNSRQLEGDHVSYSSWLRLHNVQPNTQQESQEVIRAIEKRKQLIGPGLDRGGCILITEEMRRNFVQNPGIRRFIPEDE